MCTVAQLMTSDNLRKLMAMQQATPPPRTHTQARTGPTAAAPSPAAPQSCTEMPHCSCPPPPVH